MSNNILQKVYYSLERLSGDISKDTENLTNLINVDFVNRDEIKLLAESLYGDLDLEITDLNKYKFFLKNVATLLSIKGTQESLRQSSKLIELANSLDSVSVTEMFKDKHSAYRYSFNKTYEFILKSARIIFKDNSGNYLSKTDSDILYKKLKNLIPVNVKIPQGIVLLEFSDVMPDIADTDIEDTTIDFEDNFANPLDFLFMQEIYGPGASGGVNYNCGACESLCQSCQTGNQFCNFVCQTSQQTVCANSCQSLCQIGSCQNCCEIICQTNCEFACENTRTGIAGALTCDNACETACTLRRTVFHGGGTIGGTCAQSCTTTCQGWHGSTSGPGTKCSQFCTTDCQGIGPVGSGGESTGPCCLSCETGCESSCESTCEIGSCQGRCEFAVCESGCIVWCEDLCETVHQSSCKTICQIICESGYQK